VHFIQIFVIKFSDISNKLQLSVPVIQLEISLIIILIEHEMLRGLESCPFNKTQIKSLDFAISSAFSKIFCTKSQDIIDTCRTLSNCQPVADSLCTRKRNFLCKYVESRMLFVDSLWMMRMRSVLSCHGNSLACRPT